jgi:signal transduction histidine kinase
MPSTELVPRAPPEQLTAGDHIELVGAPAESSFAPLLVDAEYRRIAKDDAPTAERVSRGALLSGKYDAELVRVAGRLLDQQRRLHDLGAQEALVLETGDNVFEATWLTEFTNSLSPLPLNARVEVSGICQVQPGPGNVRRTFKVLLRNPADVRYLGQTRFWSQPGVDRMLGLAAALTVIATLWVLLLRRQVRERTRALATANQNLVQEVEQRKQAQADLKRALIAERELGELKSRFVSLVSHEFRTPLGITMSAVELLRNYLDRLPPEKLKELLEDIYSSTLRMSALMEQVLLLGRVESGKVMARRAPLDIAGIAGKLVTEALSATNRKCPIDLKVEQSLEEVESDESLLRHILSNLLSNAVKYSPEASEVQFTVRRDNGHVEFIVRDQGIGIPEADRPHLFEAFHRASNVGQTQGTGLGLLIVKRCVELLHGEIRCESREGAGATFTVRLPLVIETQPPHRSSSSQP